jgi:hypothetical protein
VTSIAIHHLLRHVNSGASHIEAIIDIAHRIDRAAVNTHPDAKFRMTLQRFADFDGAQNRRLGIIAKNQRATVASR